MGIIIGNLGKMEAKCFSRPGGLFLPIQMPLFAGRHDLDPLVSLSSTWKSSMVASEFLKGPPNS